MFFCVMRFVLCCLCCFFYFLYTARSFFFFFFSSRRRHTRCLSDWSSDVCSSDLSAQAQGRRVAAQGVAEQADVLGHVARGEAGLRAVPRAGAGRRPRGREGELRDRKSVV